MKVGIVTFPNSVSHGAALQMYALARWVRELGHDAEIVNYHNLYMKSESYGTKTGRGSSVKRGLLCHAKRVIHHRQYAGFRRFEKVMKRYPGKALHTSGELKKLSGRYDCVICGSDQVWNPDITGSDLSYFLDFCGENTRRIAYAPSFGVEKLEEPFAGQAARELERFYALSVREAQGQALVEKLTGKQIPLMTDPTFLLSPEVWAQEETPCPIPEEGYILYYVIRSSERLMRFCRSLSEKTGLKILIVGGNAIQKRRNQDDQICYACDTEPRQWLYLVRHARYVVTNSFHGTAFSINFRKDFYVEFSSLTNSRLAHIIHTMGLEQRIVEQDHPDQVTAVDYTRTEQVLPVLRADSGRYLKNAIEGTL